MWPYVLVGNRIADVSLDGRKETPVIVFLHGFLGQGGDWLDIIAPFAGEYCCVLPDMPGHGRNTDIQYGRSISFAWLARGLHKILDSLGCNMRAHLVGYSLGGRLALYFAVHFPGRVQSLVLESASPGLSGRCERQERSQLDARWAAKLLQDGLDHFLDEWYAMPLFASLSSRSGLLDELKARRGQNDPYWMARVVEELSPGRQPALWGKLKCLNMPVLLLAGEQDVKYKALVQKMGQKILNVRIEMAPGVGHNIHLENPDWYTERLRAFWMAKS